MAEWVKRSLSSRRVQVRSPPLSGTFWSTCKKVFVFFSKFKLVSLLTRLSDSNNRVNNQIQNCQKFSIVERKSFQMFSKVFFLQIPKVFSSIFNSFLQSIPKVFSTIFKNFFDNFQMFF